MISSRNAAVFCNQFATLIASGLPLDRALTTLSRSAPTRGLRRIAAGLKHRVTEGDTLARALSAYRAHLPRLMEPLIEVGEHTGRIDDVLNALASYYDAQWDLKRTAMSHLLPMLFYFAVCGALIVFIRFVQADWNMAWLQRTIENIAFVVICIVLAILAVKLIPAVQSAIMFVGSVSPLVSSIMRQSAISRFALGMRASLDAGLDVRRAITLSAGAMANPMLGARARRAVKRIGVGLTITEALDSTGVFGPEAIGMFEAGELSGNLAETMGHVAVASRLRATTAARATLRIFGIIVYLAMLVYVAFIIISMYAGRFSEIIRSLESIGE